MELCTTRGLSTPPLLPPHHRYISHFRFCPSLQLNNSTLFSGVVSQRVGVLRATTQDSSSDGYNKFTTLEDVPSVDNDVNLDKTSPVRQNLYDESGQPEPLQSDYSSSDEPAQPFQEFLDNFNIKLDSEDSYKIVLYGGGVLVAIWLLSAVVSSIDSIPVFPKLMEVVGLGYSVWFTTRYLLFKKSREELGAKIDEIKREVLGSGDD